MKKKTFEYLKKDSLLDKEKKQILLARFNEIYEQDLYKSPYYDANIREIIGDDILREPLFVSLLDKVHKEFESILSQTDLNFEKLWLVSSIPGDVDGNKLPYIPHIDKDRSLKAMFYLHDISFDHGPIHLGIAKGNIDTEKIRRTLPHDHQLKGSNTIDEKYIEGTLSPMTGKAGDVVFFDTNTPHKAGVIKTKHYRKILRFKFKRPSFNPKPFILNRIINRIKRAF